MTKIYRVFFHPVVDLSGGISYFCRFETHAKHTLKTRARKQ